MHKKNFLFVLILIGVLMSILALKKNQKKQNEYVIGLLQTASFPALDKARDGFISEIKKEMGNRVTIITQNAQGSLIQAQAIASSFKANKNIDAFYAIATPAVQALKREVTDKPIVFAAVTDPIGLHLRDKGSNITGSTDMANIAKQIFYVKELLPNVKKVALLYNPGESNSVTLIKSMKAELTKQNISYEDDGVNSEADVSAATAHAASNAQAIIIPTDNTLSSAFPIVKQITEKANIPVIVTWTGEKEKPLMQFGVDYIHSGKQAANLMKQILEEKKAPMQIPIVSPSSEVLLNSKDLKKFNLSVSDSLKSIVNIY